MREALAHLGIPMAGARVAVQGFGNVGRATARLAQQAGARVVAVSDEWGGVYQPAGLDIEALVRHDQEAGRVAGFAGTEALTNAELLELDCEVLIPAALGHQITQTNAVQVRARMVVEGANGPTTPAADQILAERGIFLLPDILANAGGVTVSYFEWVQGLMEYFWTEEEVNERLERLMRQAFADVLKVSLREKVPMRLAAYMLAVSRVAEATRIRGKYP
jgi:glutamate dehydrogenase (NAD(P)+)